MRILLLTDRFPARLIDGPGTFVRRLAGALGAAGDQVHVLAPEPVGALHANVDGVTVHHVAEYPPLVSRAEQLAWSLQFNVGLMERATTLSMAERFDVAWVEGARLAWAGAGLTRALKLPVVAAVYERPADEVEAQAWDWLVAEARAIAARTERALADAKAAREVEVGLVSPGRDDLIEPRSADGVVCLGGLERGGGAGSVVDAIAGAQARLTIVGMGPARAALRSRARRRGIARRVKFAGALDDDALRALCASAAVVVVPGGPGDDELAAAARSCGVAVTAETAEVEGLLGRPSARRAAAKAAGEAAKATPGPVEIAALARHLLEAAAAGERRASLRIV